LQLLTDIDFGSQKDAVRAMGASRAIREASPQTKTRGFVGRAVRLK
jgi:hypothetical protein